MRWFKMFKNKKLIKISYKAGTIGVKKMLCDN